MLRNAYSTQVKAAAAHVRRLKRDQRKKKSSMTISEVQEAPDN